MTAGPALPCPKCRSALGEQSWHGTERGRCSSCGTDYEFIPFPALTASRPRAVPKSVLMAEHATCFYHAENQAEAVCESCGRFVCAICAVDFGGRRVCPPCIMAAKDKDTNAVSSRTLYGGIALTFAILPILFWPVTLLTSPAALGFVIYGWRKPGSLVGGGRARLVIAGLAAALQIVAWGLLFVRLITEE